MAITYGQARREIPRRIRGATTMTLRFSENLIPWPVDGSRFILIGGSIPPRDPDDDGDEDEDEEEEDEDDQREPPVVREPDED
jgi:hypothetical protein